MYALLVLGERERLSAASSLPTGWCAACDRQVLAFEAGEGGVSCVHCDGPLRDLGLVAEEEISELGYSRIESEKMGCATGCGSGGCGPRRI